MVTLSSYLNRDSVARLEPGPHDRLVGELIRLCLRDHSDAERSQISAALEACGMLKDQNMDMGFAMTHARLDSIREIRMAAGLLGRATRFCKGPPVHTVFCAIIPANKANEYLGLISKLGRLLLQPGIGEVFGSGDVHRVIEEIEAFDK